MSRVYPPEHPLGSAAAKVEWAESHIESLTRSTNALDPEVSFRIKGELQGAGHPLHGVSIGELTVTPNTLDTWSMIIGDIVGNLRASLDHIAWALAQAAASDENLTLSDGQERAVTFPLGNSPEGFHLNFRVPAGARDEIERFQPYNRTKWPELELLAVLDDLARADKHRLVLRTGRQVSVRIGPDQPIVFISLDQPTTQGFIIPAGYADNLEPQFTFDEVLHPAARQRRSLSFSELTRVHDFIRDEVLPAFARFFT